MILRSYSRWLGVFTCSGAEHFSFNPRVFHLRLESITGSRVATGGCRHRRQRERKNWSNRFRLAKQQLGKYVTHFLVTNRTFLCRHCTTTTWNCLNSRFLEDLKTRQLLSFSFFKLRYIPVEFNSIKICPYQTNWMRWNSRVNSLFKSRFRSHRCRCCLSSLTEELKNTHVQSTSGNSNLPLTRSNFHYPLDRFLYNFTLDNSNFFPSFPWRFELSGVESDMISDLA